MHSDATTSVATLRDAMRQFVAEREWEPFHSPKNLVMGLAVEAAELMEHFLWIDNAESRQIVQEHPARGMIGEEMADVACYLLALANVANLDLSQAITDKLAKNASKYPADKYRGRYRVENQSDQTNC
jgi:NTP pyrophosphatase (non-canonical NTP hydrolase)